MPLIQEFVQRVLKEYSAGNITQAIVLTNNSSDTRWFQSLLRDHMVCFPAGRLDFWRVDQQTFAARQGQAFFYLGVNGSAFHAAFDGLGVILEAI